MEMEMGCGLWIFDERYDLVFVCFLGLLCCYVAICHVSLSLCSLRLVLEDNVL